MEEAPLGRCFSGERDTAWDSEGAPGRGSQEVLVVIPALDVTANVT